MAAQQRQAKVSALRWYRLFAQAKAGAMTRPRPDSGRGGAEQRGQAQRTARTPAGRSRGGASPAAATPRPAPAATGSRSWPLCPRCEGRAGVTAGPRNSCLTRCMPAGPTISLRPSGGRATSPGWTGGGMRVVIPRLWLGRGGRARRQRQGGGSAKSPEGYPLVKATGLGRAGTSRKAGQGSSRSPSPPFRRCLHPHRCPGLYTRSCDQASGGDTPARGSAAARPGRRS